MYDSAEAGRLVTVSVWEVDNPNGIIYTKNEHSARWNNCTHMKCECGGIREKHYTVCEKCRNNNKISAYKALPFEEWDGKKPVVIWDGDEYFFDEDSLIDYMIDNELEDIDLLICKPIGYSEIDFGYWGEDAYEDWNPPKELQQKVYELNKLLSSLKPHSWEPGKIRTSYKHKKE
jgi:hypothetical protein